MPFPFLDPRSVAGKELRVDEACDVLVIGGGPAGLAAAIEAAEAGASVILVDENPVPFARMGEDVPLHFGGGMSPLAQNRNAMTEAWISSEPRIEEALEAGVDVRLGTAAFGLYANGESVGWLPGLCAGLVDAERTWLVGAARVVVATGARDMGLAFPGWEKPGVLGATAALRLATRYGALSARRVVVLGSTADAMATALGLAEAGIAVAALVEQAGVPAGPAELAARLRALGTEILLGHGVRGAIGRDAVEAVAVVPVGPDGRPAGPERTIPCEAIVLGIGSVPVLDLLDAVGVPVRFRAERGGFVPVLGPAGETAVAGISVAGDVAGIWAAKTLDRRVAEAEGRAAALGIPFAASPVSSEAYDLAAYRLAWVRTAVVEAAGEPHVCQCEEVTAREILEVRPPRYLGAPVDRRNDRSLRSLLGTGPPHPDQVKRLTRAGMGPCQGRRCREQVACLLALGTGEPLAAVPLAGYRAPVRPLPLALAADRREPAAMTAEWDTWFGIAPQYRLAHELPPLYTVAAGNPAGPVASE